MSLWDQFWQAYPRHVARPLALKRWAKLTQAEQEAAVAALPRHLEQWKAIETRYIPHPATWLNQQRWTDELPAPMPICRWPGCSKYACEDNGSGQYCPAHVAALKRGETP